MNPTTPMQGMSVPENELPDPWLDIMDVNVDDDRLAHNRRAFRSILAELRKLRSLDLTDVHPCVIFEPTAPYRNGPKS
jgi:hypothetical protein